MTDQWLLATMTPSYQTILMELLSLIDDIKRPALKSWVTWWRDRRGHIFRAWRPASNPPKINLAEVGHSSWTHQGARNVDLVTATKENIAEMVRLEVSLQKFQSGESNAGIPSTEAGQDGL